MSYEGRTLRVQARKFDECAAIANMYGEKRLSKRLWEYAMELRIDSASADMLMDRPEEADCE